MWTDLARVAVDSWNGEDKHPIQPMISVRLFVQTMTAIPSRKKDNSIMCQN